MEEIKNRYKLEEKLKDYDRKAIEKIQSQEGLNKYEKEK